MGKMKQLWEKERQKEQDHADADMHMEYTFQKLNQELREKKEKGIDPTSDEVEFLREYIDAKSEKLKKDIEDFGKLVEKIPWF